MRPAALVLCALPLLGYDPPQDAAGPLTARLAGPEPCALTLTSTAAATLEGVVRFESISPYRVEPAGETAFQLPPRESAVIRCMTIATGRPHEAHYPLHAYVRFPYEGQDLMAHPVLIFEARPPAAPPVAPDVAWRAQNAPANAGLALWRLPVHRAVVRVFAQPAARTLEPGWQGSDEETRAVVQFNQRVTRGEPREAVAMHPPYYQGRVGTVAVEFPLALPSSTPIRLRFANAVRDHNPERERPGDGVTFRVRALPLEAPDGGMGDILFERHTDAKVWIEGEADLTRWAGRAIRLHLESHPGPRNDTNVDLSYWAEPTLAAGTPPPPAVFPPVSEAGSRVLGRAGEHEVRVWPGARGLLDGAIGFRSPSSSTYFQGFTIRVGNDALEDWRSPGVLLETREEPAGGRYRLRHRFRDFDLVGELWTDGPALRARFAVENAPPAAPWKPVYIQDAAAGAWSARATRVYAGMGNVLVEPEAFRLNFDGHRLATSFVGFDFENGLAMVQGVDLPPTDFEAAPSRRVYTLHAPHAATFTFLPSRNVWDAAAAWRGLNGLAAAGGVRKLAGRFAFDLWSGRYADSAAALRRAARYGVRDAVVVWHNWQRHGYDYRLPDIFPPNPRLGTEDEFRDLVLAAHESGSLFAPHDNYIDFYPDAAGFDYAHIAFNAARQPVKAWLNESRGARGYRWLTGNFWPQVMRNATALKEAFAPSAYFIDVWSSAGPYDCFDQNGAFTDRVTTRDTWGTVFAWIRETLGGAPQISESGHDQLLGWLDGAQTNHLRVDRPPAGEYNWAVWDIRCKDAERVPWFDAAHHDRFIHHGAGYQTRYASGLDTRLHGTYSDDYITTEVMTGHPAMASEPFSRNAIRKYWLAGELGRALALRRIAGVEFAGGDIHRQRIAWDNGGEVTVNRGAADWSAAGRTLPQYGFHARVPAEGGVVEAAIERRGGVMVDWSRSPVQYFVNARPNVTDRLPLSAAVEGIRPLGGRRYEIAFRWTVGETPELPEGARVFVHFVDAAGAIRFQGDHTPEPPPRRWLPGAVTTRGAFTVPESAGPGDSFGVRIGFWDPRDGSRYLPEGVDDGTRRIQLGDLRVTSAGVEFAPFEPGPDPLLARLNPEGRVIAFDYGVSTNAAVRLSPAGDSLWVTPLPGTRGGVVRLRWASLPWRLTEPAEAAARDEADGLLRVEPLARDRGEIVLTLASGVFAYQLRPPQSR